MFLAGAILSVQSAISEGDYSSAVYTVFLVAIVFAGIYFYFTLKQKGKAYLRERKFRNLNSNIIATQILEHILETKCEKLRIGIKEAEDTRAGWKIVYDDYGYPPLSKELPKLREWLEYRLEDSNFIYYIKPIREGEFCMPMNSYSTYQGPSGDLYTSQDYASSDGVLVGYEFVKKGEKVEKKAEQEKKYANKW